MSRPYGYNCPVCGEPIIEPEPTEHTSDGLAHAACVIIEDPDAPEFTASLSFTHRMSDGVTLACIVDLSDPDAIAMRLRREPNDGKKLPRTPELEAWVHGIIATEVVGRLTTSQYLSLCNGRATFTFDE